MFLHYGFDPASAVVWLEVPTGDAESGLCRTHAERLTPPKGWTIDDRRDPTLRLFRPGPKDASREDASRAAKTRKAKPRSAAKDQDSLFIAQTSLENNDDTSAVVPDDRTESDDQMTSADREGLSPLLSRAFRGTPFSGD